MFTSTGGQYCRIIIKAAPLWGGLCLLSPLVLGQNVNMEGSLPVDECVVGANAETDESGVSNQECHDQSGTLPDEDALTNIEVVEVRGEFIGLQVPEIQGRFHLDRDFLTYTPQGSGDLTDVLPLLPGILISDESLGIDELAEIRAKPISISGAQPWQTGFFLDGMNYNSRQDPASYDRSVTSINDVQGHPQAMNLNMAILESVDVYDNNVPVEFGSFSGGVVDAESISAVVEKNSLELGMRGTRSNWGLYHLIEPENEENVSLEEEKDLEDLIPVFEKETYTVMGGLRMSDRQGLLLGLNQVDSTVSEISLQQPVLTDRNNINALLKYSLVDGFFDRADVSAVYAPYENNNIRKDTLNSDMTLRGGGAGLTLSLAKVVGGLDWTGELSVSRSENSRRAPDRYFIWNQARGKDWGQLADHNDDEDPVSLEGNLGDLDKLQTSADFNSQVMFSGIFNNIEHHWKAGLNIGFDKLDRNRPSNVYYYNSAVQYSTLLGSTPLNCSGYQIDCLELAYHQPLSVLEEQLGGPLDFSNPDHVLAYSDNIAQTPQYFQSRLIYPREDIVVDMLRASLYASDSFDWNSLQIYLGLRYDWDDFFRNHNLAPRIQLGWDIAGDNSMLVVTGVNRYYDAGLLSYKIREQQEPFYTQYRSVSSSYLQGWLRSSADSDYRTRYDDVKTPYDDEWVLGWKHSTFLGNYSIQFVQRWKHDQLARAGASVLGNDGYRYAYQDNSGSAESQRISLSWHKHLGNHSIWANTSFFESQTNNTGDYDSIVDDTPADELVFYDGEVITKADLERIDADFDKPLSLNFGWTAQWFENLTTSVSATFKGSYSAAVTKGYYQTDTIEWACPECESSRLSVPNYKRIDYDERILFNFSVHTSLSVASLGKLRFSADLSNLFNSRIHDVIPGESGIEVGRQLWLSVSMGI